MAIDACLAGLLWTPRNPIDRLFSLGGVLALPVLIERVRRLGQPRPVFHLFQQGCRRGIRSRVLRRIAQGLEQPGRHQHRNVMGLAIQHPEGWHGAPVIRPQDPLRPSKISSSMHLPINHLQQHVREVCQKHGPKSILASMYK